MKIDFKYLFDKAWLIIIFAGVLGYIIYEVCSGFMDYLPSKIVVTSLWSASLMYAGLVVGFRLGNEKKTKKK